MFGWVRLVYLFMPHIAIFLHDFFLPRSALALKALLCYWNAAFCQCHHGYGKNH